MAQLSYVSDFIKKIYENNKPGSVFNPRDFHISNRRDEEVIYFEDDEALEYRRILDKLCEDFRKKRFSLRTVKSFFDDAIFGCFDISSRSDKPFEDRLIDALNTITGELRKNPSIFTCYVPVEGIAVDGLPLNFGNVRLVVYNQSQFRNLKRRQNPNLERFIGQIKDDYWKHTYAVCARRFRRTPFLPG